MTVTIGAACTACGACLITCPDGALSPAPARPLVDAARCTDCLACVEVCPADVISPARRRVVKPPGRLGPAVDAPHRG